MEMRTKFKHLSEKVDVMSKEVDGVLSDVYQIMYTNSENGLRNNARKEFQPYIDHIVKNNNFKDIKVISINDDKAIIYIEVEEGIEFEKRNNKCSQQFYIIQGELNLCFSYRDKKNIRANLSEGSLFDVYPTKYIKIGSTKNAKIIITLS